jgi:HEAT repeat protein
MKHVSFFLALFSSSIVLAQAPQSLPQTLPELAKMLPSLVHEKKFELGSFSDAVDLALRNDQSSTSAAIPLLSMDLRDPDPDVQFNTLVVMGTLAAQRENADLFQPVMPQLAAAISSGSQYSQAAAIYVISELGPTVSDPVIVPIERLLLSRPSDKLTLLAAEALMMTRPSDETAQRDVISAINDSGRSIELRQQILHVSSVEGVGSEIISNVLQIVETSEDKRLRDAAIRAAEQIGPSALNPIHERLVQIAQDPSESLASHRLVHHALLAGSGE